MRMEFYSMLLYSRALPVAVLHCSGFPTFISKSDYTDAPSLPASCDFCRDDFSHNIHICQLINDIRKRALNLSKGQLRYSFKAIIELDTKESIDTNHFASKSLKTISEALM